jgi:hypothetical protein
MERMARRSSIKFERGVLCEKSAVTKKNGFSQTPPDLVVKFQHVDNVAIILRLVLRPARRISTENQEGKRPSPYEAIRLPLNRP